MQEGRYARELEVAIEAAMAAGKVLRDEFCRPGGPRGSHGHCPADGEAEALIRERLSQAFPKFGIRGEELAERDRESSDADGRLWLIDPNDGTSAFLQGWRGAAVSIALIRRRQPVLGVVYAHSARAGKGDLISWAKGTALMRNGSIVNSGARASADHPLTIMVSQSADRRAEANIALCTPARFRAEPSIAYRLALVAAGEGIAAVSLNGPTDWDVAAGHALLRAVGGELYRMGGDPVVYDDNGRANVGDCVGGFGPLARELATRKWSEVFRMLATPAENFDHAWPARGEIFADSNRLDRAQGCILGQLAGDNLGALVEFQTPQSVAKIYPGGVRRMEEGGYWDILAGQPTDDSELALMLARSILEQSGYDREAAASAYAWWYNSNPFDIGTTIAHALGPALKAIENGRSASEAAIRAAAIRGTSQANGALMQVSPLAIYGYEG
jgi:fructose-1,6-bisphosphatase/inositol monophosphatase family enzyme